MYLKAFNEVMATVLRIAVNIRHGNVS